LYDLLGGKGQERECLNDDIGNLRLFCVIRERTKRPFFLQWGVASRKRGKDAVHSRKGLKCTTKWGKKEADFWQLIFELGEGTKKGKRNTSFLGLA